MSDGGDNITRVCYRWDTSLENLDPNRINDASPVLPTPAATRKILGRRLAVARCDQGLTQTEVAATAGITRPQLANIEAGRSRPSVDSFAFICRAIGIKMDDVYWGT